MSFILLDYECLCGWATESFETRSAPSPWLPCPRCPNRAERVLSPVRSGTVWGAAASRGKSDPRPNPGVLDTQPLADGMPYSEWKRKRREFRAEERRQEIKKELG